VCASCTSSAVLLRYVCWPVPYTIASLSPRRMIEPQTDRLAGTARGGQRLSRQRGLIYFYGVSLQQARIRGHDVTQAHADDGRLF
jgi:hypothetical protein